MELFVGQAALQGGIRRYPFDLLELLVDSSLPQDKKLAEFRETKPACVFSLRLPPSVVESNRQAEALLERTVRAVPALGARWCVLTTGPNTTPTTRNRQALARIFERVRAVTPRLAWEPRGVWGESEAEAWASELGVTLVRDVSRDEPPAGDVVYTRLRALGFGSRVSPNAVERLAERLEGASEAYVVIEGDGALRAASLLKQLCLGSFDAG
jgi:hypothetical protein